MKTTTAYQVIELSGKQYLVHEGDVLVSDRLNTKINETLKIDKVLLNVAGDQVDLGNPYLTACYAKATILKHYLGEKIRVAKFKAKTGYRRVNGYRPSFTQVRIDKLI